MRIHSLIASIIALPVLASTPTGSLNNLPNPRTMPAAKITAAQPQVQRFTLSNGIRVLFTEDRELPLVNVYAGFKAGQLEDPQDKAGLAIITISSMRLGGTQSYTHAQFDEKLDDLAIKMGFTPAEESSYGGFKCFKDDAPKAFELFAEMLRAPRFATDRVDFVRNQLLMGLEQALQQPMGIASIGISRLIYNGKGKGNIPTPESIKAITESDLNTFAKTWIVPNNMVLGISGNLTLSEAKSLADKAFGDWKTGQLPSLTRSSEATQAQPGIYFRKKDKLNQSVVLAGLKGFKESDPDRVALGAAFNVLGQAEFGNRLFNTIRTQHGLAYHAGCNINFAKTVEGNFSAIALTKSESTVKALQIMREECLKLAKNGITAEEWDNTQRSFLNKELFANATSANVIEMAVDFELFGQPLDTRAKRLEKLQSLTLKDVNEAIQRSFKPENLRFYVLGDPATFGENKLESLGKVNEINS